PGGLARPDHGRASRVGAGGHRGPHRRLGADAARGHDDGDPAALHVGVRRAQGGERAARDPRRSGRGAPPGPARDDRSRGRGGGVGRAINRNSVEGQMEGGAAMGIGYALLEEDKVARGVTLTPNLMTYLIPTALDVPDISTIVLESGEGMGPWGARGIGEPAL